MCELPFNITALCSQRNFLPTLGWFKRKFVQSGFTSGWTTMDVILALRLLFKVQHEFIQPLHDTFVDLKVVFDSVNRLALWKILRGSGVPQYLLHLESLLTGNDKVVSRLTTICGVRRSDLAYVKGFEPWAATPKNFILRLIMSW